jgi:hypothetical protein
MIDVLDKIWLAGGTVEVHGGDLRIGVPKGLLSLAERRCLAENKKEILAHLTDPEREAIQWVELLPTEEAAKVVETARREWEELVAQTPIVVQAEYVDGELRLHCPSEELAAKIEAGREYLEQVQAEINADIDAEVELPRPCVKCGGFVFWWDFIGQSRCVKCEASVRERSQQVAKQAASLRPDASSTPRPHLFDGTQHRRSSEDHKRTHLGR